MDDNDSFLYRRYEDAILEIEYYLAKNPCYSRLIDNPDEKGIIWKTEYTNSINTWEIYIIFSKYYPDELPKIKINNVNDLFLTNPHIEEDGKLCIIQNTTNYDGDELIKNFEYLIESAKSILDGTSETDFQDEFESYWIRNASPYGEPCILISSPEDNENIYSAFIGKELICIAKNNDLLISWMFNFCSMEKNNFSERKCFILRLDKPLLPNQYPNSIYDVLELAKYNNEIYQPLIHFIINSNKYCFILLVQKNKSTYSLGGIKLSGLNLCKIQKYSNGFRVGYAPSDILINRATNKLKDVLINRCIITRADHNYIHSRGGDGKIHNKRKIILLGCGSLGGYLAHYLTKTGIGNITIIDSDTLEFANIGRHILGGDSFGQSKALALHNKLRNEMPHLIINGINSDWREAYKNNKNIFHEADLIISTMAEWRSEKPLNLLARANDFPPVIYAWLESFAVAGHCFISIPKSGCIECQMDKKGLFQKRVASFDDIILKKEIGSCTYYQEYGPSALMPIISMIISEIINIFTNEPSVSKLSTWITDISHLSNVKAKITSEWENQIKNFGYSRIYNNDINRNENCRACTRI